MHPEHLLEQIRQMHALNLFWNINNNSALH
jgi:hypothetical protein